MDIFSVFTMVGGLALFLYGMNIMGESLSKLSGGKLEILLEKLTSSKIRALVLGALVTAVIQSSSATTVMVVGFVNSGIMKLTQAVGIIMGANIGTTITSWLLSLTGISGSNVFIKLLKPSSFSPLLALVGIILTMSSHSNNKKKDIGTILLGFAILMFGMETMSGSVAPLAHNEHFTNLLTMFSNPFLGMIAGAILTAVIQSSSASVGILQALCLTGVVGYGTAIPIIMGQNIGTCVTAIISSVGANKNARRASMIHLYFNLIGTIVFMIAFYSINHFVHFEVLSVSASAVGIAVIHSLFNVGCAIFMYPFSGMLVKLSELSVRDAKMENTINSLPGELSALDDRFLTNPSFAMELAKTAAYRMAEETLNCVKLALTLPREYNKDKIESVHEYEDRIDIYEDVLGSYLVKISSRDLLRADSEQLSVLLHCTSDLERISDLSAELADSISEMIEKGESFSKKALAELSVLIKAVDNICDETVKVFIASDNVNCKNVLPLEEVIDSLNVRLRQNHIKRLRKGKCTVELGIILEDMISILERISDHCSNISVCMLEVGSGKFEAHEYLAENIKKTPWFSTETDRLKLQYSINKEVS